MTQETNPTSGTTGTTSSGSTTATSRPDTKLEYEFHPIANIFPMMEGAEFKRFKEDIRTRKQQEPIIIHDGKILDGRNRYRACNELKLTPDTKLLPTGTDPVGYVLSANLHRRHLNESQRAMVAAKLASLSVGANQHTKEGLSIERASKLSTASVATANRCKKVLNDGVPELAQMIEKGQVPASLAEEVAKLPKEKQAELVKNKPSDFKKAAKQATAKASGAKTPEQLSDEIEELVGTLIEKLKEVKAKNADNAVADVADLIRRLHDADLWTEPKKKAA